MSTVYINPNHVMGVGLSPTEPGTILLYFVGAETPLKMRFNSSEDLEHELQKIVADLVMYEIQANKFSVG